MNSRVDRKICVPRSSVKSLKPSSPAAAALQCKLSLQYFRSYLFDFRIQHFLDVNQAPFRHHCLMPLILSRPALSRRFWTYSSWFASAATPKKQPLRTGCMFDRKAHGDDIKKAYCVGGAAFIRNSAVVNSAVVARAATALATKATRKDGCADGGLVSAIGLEDARLNIRCRPGHVCGMLLAAVDNSIVAGSVSDLLISLGRLVLGVWENGEPCED
jgi:hypothetical protein